MPWLFVPNLSFTPALTGCEPWRPGFEHLGRVQALARSFAAVGRESRVSGLEQSAVSWRFRENPGRQAGKSASSPAVTIPARGVRGAPEMGEINNQVLTELVEAVKQIVRKEQSD